MPSSNALTILVTVVLYLVVPCALAAAQTRFPNSIGFATPFGFNVGRHWADDGKEGATLGGEVSVVRVAPLRTTWYGGFFDADVLMRSGSAKLTTGLEVGRWPLGLDVGVLWSSLGPEGQWGFQSRFHLTAICSSLYAGGGITRSPAAGEGWQGFGLFGLLLKIPVLYIDPWPMIPFPRDVQSTRGR